MREEQFKWKVFLLFHSSPAQNIYSTFKYTLIAPGLHLLMCGPGKCIVLMPKLCHRASQRAALWKIYYTAACLKKVISSGCLPNILFQSDSF